MTDPTKKTDSLSMLLKRVLDPNFIKFTTECTDEEVTDTPMPQKSRSKLDEMGIVFDNDSLVFKEGESCPEIGCHGHLIFMCKSKDKCPPATLFLPCRMCVSGKLTCTICLSNPYEVMP